ncbi:MAG: hypothetical protein U0Q55_16905 [Vicinamibacterales bacterium]
MTRTCRYLLCVMACIALCGGRPASAQNPSQPLAMQIVEFSWALPTGAVVPQGATAVTLDRGMGFQMRFTLPADCRAMTEAYGQYGNGGSAALEQQYTAAARYCERARPFTLGTASATRDFVSRASFTSLSLDLIPFDLRCRGENTPEWSDLCARVRTRDTSACAPGGTLPPQVSYARFLVQADEATHRLTLDCRPLRIEPASCRLSASLFIGTATARNGLVRCAFQPPGSGAAGLRLTDVAFRDVNRDGLMDAILTVTQEGGRVPSPAPWFTFALTRRSPTGAFERVPLE